MHDELFNIKALLEIVFRITMISANRFAQDFLNKDPAVIAKWKTGQLLPGMEDLFMAAEVVSKKSMETQKVQIRIEIEDLIVSSTLPEPFKKVILGKDDFKEFLLEALSASIIKPSKPVASKYQEQLAFEILEDIACIDSRLYHLYEYKFYNEEWLKIDLQQVEAFTEAVLKLPVKTDLKDRLTGLKKENKLNCKYIRFFYDEIAELSGQYNSLIEFLTVVACDNSKRMEILSCYIEFIKSSIDIIRSSTNITYITGILALSHTGIHHKSSPLALKSISCLKSGDITDKPEIAINCFSNYLAEYSKLVDEKAGLLEKLRLVGK